jgi:hypothetical protein
VQLPDGCRRQFLGDDDPGRHLVRRDVLTAGPDQRLLAEPVADGRDDEGHDYLPACHVGRSNDGHCSQLSLRALCGEDPLTVLLDAAGTRELGTSDDARSEANASPTRLTECLTAR